MDGIPFNDNIFGSALYGSNASSASSQTMSYDGSLRTVNNKVNGPLAMFPVNNGTSNQYAWVKLNGNGPLDGWTFQFHDQAWDYATGLGWAWQIPDQPEDMSERRQIGSLAYSSKLGANWTQDYMLAAQRHAMTWNLRFYPDNGMLGAYPSGVNEYVNTSASNWFGRGQWSVGLAKDSNFLFGLEANRFLYVGDQAHTSNINPNNGLPNTGNATENLGPLMAYIQNEPIVNTGFYGQFTSGKLLGNMFKLVAGLRADRFSYNVLTSATPGGPTEARTYSQTSPRLALIFTPLDNLAIKAMAGSAFRAPSPSELGTDNSLTASSNIAGLQPETLKTFELAVDWIINANLDWRTNVFHTQFSNEIGFSPTGQNLVENLYTLTTEGLETELLFGYAGWRGFANYSYNRRVDETIIDPSIAPSPNQLPWVPASTFKLGVIYTTGQLVASLTGYSQGSTQRRTSDMGTQSIPFSGGSLDVDAYRPRTLDSWFSLNSKVTYQVNHAFSVSGYATNLLDTSKNRTIQTGAFPSDYQGAGRVVGMIAKLKF